MCQKVGGGLVGLVVLGRGHKERAHLKKEEKEQILGQCKECGKNMLRDSIKRHMRTVHKETKECEDKTENYEFILKS